MNVWPLHDKTRAFAGAFAAGAALLCASLGNFLHYNEYPLFRPEVGLIVSAFLAISALMAVFYRAQRQWGRSFLEGFLVALFVDLNTDWLVAAGILGAAVALFTWWRRTSLMGPMAVLGLVVLVTTMLGLGGNPHWIKVQKGTQPARAAAAAGKPAIVHIILDEHIGLEGLPDDAEGRRLRDELRAFYLANGFAVYGGAYSQHYETVNAIPELLNYGKGLGRAVSKSGVEAGPTKYLQSLVDRGYRLTILQSDYVDYCTDARFSECITYDSSSLRPTLAVPMGTGDRAGLVGGKFLALSDIFGAAASFWNVGAGILRDTGVRVPLYEPNSGQSSTVGTLEAMNELTDRLKSARPGDAIFAHLLLPHFPHVVRGDCGYLPWAIWKGRYFGSTIEARRRAYYEQVRCTARKVQSALQALAASPAGTNAVVIIHGDHGSRIVRVNPYAYNSGRISDADMIAGFSTLFAIRAPGMQPGYFPERQPIVPLLRDFAASGFRAAPHPRPPQVHTVYLADTDWKPVRRVPLPESWTKGFDRPVAGH